MLALDFLAGGAVEEPPRDTPPATPVSGICYIVGTAPTGAWSGNSGSLAAFTDGGWRFAEPKDGMTLYVRSLDAFATFRAGAWEIGKVRGSSLVIDGEKVVGARCGSIGTPAGGTTVDGEARAAIGQILAAMRQHGLIEL